MKILLRKFFTQKKHVRFLLSIWIILLLFAINIAQAQKISPYLVGNNYWMPGSMITEFMKPGGLVDQADIQTIRIGGFGPNGWSDAQYLEYIRRIKAMGALPIVQVRASYSAQQATDFIKLVNVTNNLGVKAWSIGNEPDHSSGGSQSDAQVADYTKRIAAALKSVDPTITVIAAEYASYNGGRYANLIGGANSITGLVPGKDYYYVDVIGFHRYVITDVSQLMGSINDLVAKVNAANASRPAGKKLKWGMGEFNSHYNNDMTGDPNMKVWSFNNGQFHAELWGVGMQKEAFSLDSWSMIEGPDRGGTDLSLFDKDYKGRSTYWHSLMFGQNMKENYLPSNDNQTGVGIVSMGDATGAAVMIINKSGTAYNYTIRLDNGALGTGGLQISVNAGINKTDITGSIGATTTQMLVFCPNGTLLKRYTYSKANCDARAGAKIEAVNPDCGPVCENNIPTINQAPNQAYEVGSGVQDISLTGISDGDGCTQNVIVSAVSSAPSIVAVSGVTYTTCNPTGSVAINPLARGNATITVTVTDGGTINCGPAKKTMSFEVNVDKIWDIPGRIQAEDFSTMTGIQTETTTDVGGGMSVGYTNPGDYMNYNVKVAATGTYKINFRVASMVTTGSIQLKDAAGNILASVLVPTTGGWQNWVTLPGNKSFTMTEGVQPIQIYWAGAGANLNWFEILADKQELSTITLTPASATVFVGQTQQFTAVGKDINGVVMPINPTWTTTGCTLVSGLFSCNTPGTYTVCAEVGTIKGCATLIVKEASVLTTITLSPATPSIVKGQTQQFTAVGKDQYGVEMPITPTWSENAPNGLFTGTTIGTFTVSAQSGTVMGPASITVTDDPSFPIPGKIEAEAFTAMQGIQTQPTTDTGGGLNIGYVDAGDWLDYKVNVSAAGKYNVSFRVASQLATGAFQLKVGATVLATVKVPNTGGWQNWQTVVVPVTLAQGIQTLRIAATGAGLNINWFSFVEAPFSIKIEAESYTSMFGIQTQATTDAGGGLNVGYTEPGDWMNYSVTVPTAGVYTVNFRVASLVATGKIELRNSAGTALATLAQGATGGWQTWVTKSVTATLPAGIQTLRIYYTGAGLNINWFELVAGGLKSSEIAGENGTISENEKLEVYPNPANSMVTIETGSSNFNFAEIHSLTGATLISKPISSNKTVLDISSLNKGLYLISIKGNARTITQKLIVK
jgi:hypothetical protein